MCGFGGILNSPNSIDHNRAANLAKKVSYRGPDSCRTRILNTDLTPATEGPNVFFFNRLAIVDVDHRSDQPFENERYLLTFNGEIYNYLQLRSELAKLGIPFVTSSDTEVLFHALRVWGLKALEKLNGMFAFFWLDKKEKKFIAARDRLGIKPFYYSMQQHTFCFASELDSVVRMRGGSPAISREAVDMYLWMQYVPTPYTIIEGIQKLPPGHYLEGDSSNPGIASAQTYWNAYHNVIQPSETDQQGLETLLKDSLSKQLHADVPLGLFLSSGVDSSLLAALVNKYFSEDNTVNFFTVQFAERTASDESEEAAQFIQKFNNPRLQCNTISIDPHTVRDRILRLYDYYDEPFGDPAALLNWVISEKAREYVTVALSGDGADELFWGYERYNRWQKFTKISTTPPVPQIIPLILGACPPSRFKDNIRFLTEQDPVKRHLNLFLPSGMRFSIRDHIAKYPMWALEGTDSIRHRADLPAILDIKTYLADAMLYKVDRSSMASSLEVRVPYLDNQVLDYALSMPLDKKSTPTFRNKAPLKQLLLELAPHYNVDKPKKGFNFPLQKWLKNEWKELVLDTVHPADLEAAGLNPAPYMNIVNGFYASKNHYFTDVWYIFNLSLWIKKIKTIESEL